MAGWLVIFPLLAFVSNFVWFVVLTTVLGFWFGAHFAVSRSTMASLAPDVGRNLAFAYFSLVERLSSFVGPVVWGVTVTVFMDSGVERYRFAMCVLTVFVVLAFLCLLRVRSSTVLAVE